ncbi:MAG: 50S ribosomal protein L15 [Candidatus [Bacteroides] periocalifornicus]|uniref:Large ribosomal subunit protein uL15 n=1 Tax=Candidatus [Bacteroides] periocalifornicus TaxID=1702214 RepID=A0A0Q4B4U5_9BACT|nr:MAG: 50S ribosomal protein L15 [Candidatus [Bacteroides] periocalifornicus]
MASEVKLHTLRPNPRSNRERKRVGRGQGSGYGGTSTRGHKGAKSRSGYSRKIGFEGGQMPLQRRLPKFGFKNPFRIEYRVVNLSELQSIAEQYKVSTINLELFYELRKAKRREPVKILGGGELVTKLDVTANAFSESARKAIEALGGTATTI